VSQVLAWHRREALDAAAMSQWGTAVWHFNRLLEKQPNQHLYWVARAYAFIGLDQPEKAVADYTQGLALRPDDGWALAGRGLLRAGLGRWAEADRDLARAVDRGVPDVQVWYGHLLLRLRQAGHVGYRRAARRLAPELRHIDDHRLFNYVAWCFALAPDALTDYRPVLEMARQAVDEDSDKRGARNTLGAVLYRAGQYREALQQLNRALQEHGRGGTVNDWVFLAMVHHRLGQAGEARKWLGKAKEEIDRTEKQRPAKDRQSMSRQEMVAYLFSWAPMTELRLLYREAEALISKPKP
jgi:tetratricopeptide (TPR) repeat protein